MPESPRRALAVGLGLVMLVAAVVAAGQPAESSRAQATEHPIVTVAKQYLNTYQGDCWPFVRKVVLEATGKQMGFGYIQGFLEGGAYEVPYSEARNGDIVQIVDDARPGPGVSYNGLHTAIIVDVNPDGTFHALDSNQKWDGVVRWRPNYNPALRAAQLGLNVHVFRFDAGSGGGGGAPAPAPAEPPDGTPATVSADGDGLRLRSEPSTTASIIATIPDGTTVWITGPLAPGGGLLWAPVYTHGWGHGWMAAAYLVVQGESPPPPPPTGGTGGSGAAAMPYGLAVSGVSNAAE